MTEGGFQTCLGLINDLHDDSIDDLTDEAAFQLLDESLYLDDDRTSQQVYEDALHYSKFNFLTGWGESFDGVKAFLLVNGDRCRILYRSSLGASGGAEITRVGLVSAMQGFLAWMVVEKQAVPPPETVSQALCTSPCSLMARASLWCSGRPSQTGLAVTNTECSRIE